MPPEATLPRKPLDLILIGGQVGAGVGKESFIVALQRANGGCCNAGVAPLYYMSCDFLKAFSIISYAACPLR